MVRSCVFGLGSLAALLCGSGPSVLAASLLSNWERQRGDSEISSSGESSRRALSETHAPESDIVSESPKRRCITVHSTTEDSALVNSSSGPQAIIETYTRELVSLLGARTFESSPTVLALASTSTQAAERLREYREQRRVEITAWRQRETEGKRWDAVLAHALQELRQQIEGTALKQLRALAIHETDETTGKRWDAVLADALGWRRSFSSCLHARIVDQGLRRDEDQDQDPDQDPDRPETGIALCLETLEAQVRWLQALKTALDPLVGAMSWFPLSERLFLAVFAPSDKDFARALNKPIAAFDDPDTLAGRLRKLTTQAIFAVVDSPQSHVVPEFIDRESEEAHQRFLTLTFRAVSLGARVTRNLMQLCSGRLDSLSDGIEAPPVVPEEARESFNFSLEGARDGAPNFDELLARGRPVADSMLVLSVEDLYEAHRLARTMGLKVGETAGVGAAPLAL